MFIGSAPPIMRLSGDGRANADTAEIKKGEELFPRPDILFREYLTNRQKRRYEI
jgi:hypothetical protein